MMQEVLKEWQWTVIVTWNQKMMIFLPDGNDSVAESSDGDMPDEQIPHMHVILLKPGKCLFPKVIPHFNMATFCYHDNSTFIHTHTKKHPL